MRNVEFLGNGSSMEITFSNPDAATCVRRLFSRPCLHYQHRPPQKSSLHVWIYCLWPPHVSSMPLHAISLRLLGECDTSLSDILCRIARAPLRRDYLTMILELSPLGHILSIGRSSKPDLRTLVVTSMY